MRIPLLPTSRERLFERYRTRGDAAALGEVFDRTAPELFGLAQRLAPSVDQAADLLQATFLAAIESAVSWEGTRPLLPWLVGILAREARALRRREARAIVPERLPERSVPDPAGDAEVGELLHAVRAALADLPAPYREVLQLHLGEEEAADEIAGRLGRKAGTVRVQIHRGLALLRKTLPAGLALGGALVALSPRTLAAMRARVLAAAAGRTAAIGTGSALIGGILMKKLVLGFAVLVALGGAWWLARGPRELRPGDPVRPASVLAVEAPPTRGSATGLGKREAARSTEGYGGTALADTRPPAPADAYLSGIRGRVVEVDGRPVAGILVARSELAPELLIVDGLAALEERPGPPRIALASARTDAEGVFWLRGASARSLQALAIDPDGPRASLRVLEEALHAGETSDLGDLVLAPAGKLTGRVVDEAGNPLAGVRVRAAPLPRKVLDLGLERLRRGCLLVQLDRERRAHALELPEWAGHLLERLPVPTAVTGADGAFALSPPLGPGVTLVADADGFAADVLPELVLGSDPLDVGTRVLRAGRSATARVLAAGQPVEGAEVFAGTLGPRGSLAICSRAEPAGEPGLYRASGLASGSEVFAVRVGGGQWTVAGPFDGAGTKEVRLDELCALTLVARDEHGAPVEGLRVALQSAGSLAGQEETAFLAAFRSVEELVRVDASTYRLAGLPPGRYRILARAEGQALLRCEVEVRPDAPPVPLEFRPGGTLHVRVSEEASGAPLPDVEVGAFVGRQGRLTLASRGRTDSEGRVRLDRPIPGPSDELFVRATSEGLAPSGLVVRDAPGELELRLAQPASVSGRVQEAGRAPAARYLIALRPSDEALRKPGNLPFHALTDSTGRFRISGLPPGMFRVQVGERFLAGDPLLELLGGRLGSAFDSDKGILERRFHDGTVELRAGATAELAIELPGGAGATRLRGRILRAGRPLAGLEVELDGSRGESLRKSDARGAFDFGFVAPGKARLKVEDVVLGRTILRAELELAEGEERVLELVLDPLVVDVVLVRGQAPVAGAELSFRPLSPLYDPEPVRARTDETGSCRVSLPGCGQYAWHAEVGDEKAGGEEGHGEVSVLSDERVVLSFSR